MDKLLTQKELAKRWQISERWVEKLRQTGKGPVFVALGESPKLKTIRYRLADVEIYEHIRATGGQKSIDPKLLVDVATGVMDRWQMLDSASEEEIGNLCRDLDEEFQKYLKGEK